MAASDARSDDVGTTFPVMRVLGCVAVLGVSTARQRNSARRQGSTYAGFSVADRPFAQGGTTQL